MPNGDDKELKVSMEFDDNYTDKVEEAADSTEKLDKSLQDTEESALEANIAFLATMEAIDQVGGSVAKIRAGLEDLGIVTEEQAAALRKIEGAADLFTGTAQLATIATHGWKKATDLQKTSLLGVAAAAAAAGSAVMAMNAETAEQRALYSTLTGITAGLAIAQFTLALAQYSSAVAAAGPAAPIMAALIGGSLIAATTYWASTKAAAGAQTGPGEIREAEVMMTGQVEVHQGERMRLTRDGRTPASLRGMAERRGGDINLTVISPFDPFLLESSGNLDSFLGQFITANVRGLKS